MNGDAMDATGPGPPVLDRRALMASVEGDTGLLATLLQIFREDAVELFASLEEAAREGDAVALAETAHTLKGSVLLFGGKRAVALAMELEAGARDGSLADAPDSVTALREAVVELQGALDAEIESVEGSA